MAVKLFEHNLEAYNAAVAMMDKKGKAVIVHPTGTGKSFIGFKLAEDNPNKQILWLTPSEYIVKTQLENLRKEGGAELNNITFVTYARLMLMSEDEITELKPDIVIADEHHRIGAARWMTGFEKIMKIYPNAKYLGLSATNIRYLDNQRNMADEIFDGNIASEMTLGEAIVRGILLPPQYIISVYGYRSELEKYEGRIEAINNEAVRAKGKSELDNLRRALEMSEGLETVFRKHMKNKSGKYIVFCSNRNHLDEMISHVCEWFGGVDPYPHIYKVYSEDLTASKEFLEFKEDSSEHLKLLYCIDMLNEGVHVNDIDGVIMLRPTVSPIIYKQQIGRALSANKDRNPIIFDVVNNFENLCSISTIQEEIRLAVSYYRSIGEDSRIVCDSFEIIDKTCDCRSIFESLEGSLSSTWDMYFQAAKEYYEEHGDLHIAKGYVTEDGLTLGMWLATQRRVKRGSAAGMLTEERIEKLNSIGMVWDNILEMRWEIGFEHAREYYEQFGNLDVSAQYISEDGYQLGAWITRNRTWYRNNSHKGILDSERVERLNSIGMMWSRNNAMWEKNYLAAAEYFKENGNLDVAIGYVNKDGIKLGIWVSNQKNAYKKGDLTDEQIERLEMIGMQWLSKHDRQWMENYRAACLYYKEHGNLDVPLSYRTNNGIILRKWLYKQQKNTKLSTERKRLIESIGGDRRMKNVSAECG